MLKINSYEAITLILFNKSITMKYVACLVILTTLISCKVENVNVNNQLAVVGSVDNKPKQVYQKGDIVINAYNFQSIEPLFHKKDGKTYVINFWATWCKPCVAELPHFEHVKKEYESKNVEVILISLDLPTMVETNLLPFLEKHQLKSQVVLLDDPKQNEWIPKVSENWEGSIPATLIYNENQRAFFEKTFTLVELKNNLDQILKSN